MHTYSGPRLPWRILERVVDLSSSRPNTLCSLALTCRRLRHPSHLAMFGRVQLESSDHVFAFIAFLQANPELKPFVHTIVATPAAFGPSPLYLLPNLSSIECVDESQLEQPEDEDTDEGDDRVEESRSVPDYTRPQTAARARAQRSLVVHHTSLACFAQLGAHVRALRLSSVSLPTLLSFAQMLLAFASITRLVCEEVEIQAECGAAPLEVAVQRLSERIQLKELVVSVHLLFSGPEQNAPSLAAP
uniref:Guanine nucleotide-binding protein subunit beta-like protein (Cytoplasmic antigenic protein 1) n=1 Tax=Ganoderma boninense TaxID=34458 RepID=A0A5K1K5Z3_9APHY|nr:Guanine nucleotide-binding protein subunit beta-like protein (Cytoplasmic antigenic protein 1) [Ganoderma boninense]